MKDRHTSICEKHKVLAELKTIPAEYHLDLEERLGLAFQEFGRRQTQSGDRKTILVRHRQKKAAKVYSTIFDRRPNTFLPFLLAISPRACRTFNAFNYCEQYNELAKIAFSDAARQILEHLARKRHIYEKPRYKEFLYLLFPRKG